MIDPPKKSHKNCYSISGKKVCFMGLLLWFSIIAIIFYLDHYIVVRCFHNRNRYQRRKRIKDTVTEMAARYSQNPPTE